MNLERYTVLKHVDSNLFAVYDNELKRQLTEDEIVELEIKFSQQATRYVSTITVYTYGITPEMAFRQSQEMCNSLNLQFDCKASVEKFHKQPSGTLHSEEIDIHSLKIK